MKYWQNFADILYGWSSVATYESMGDALFGVPVSDMSADEIGDTLLDDLLDSLCASLSILK